MSSEKIKLEIVLDIDLVNTPKEAIINNIRNAINEAAEQGLITRLTPTELISVTIKES